MEYFLIISALAAQTAAFEPLLFMAMDDIVDPWGLVYPLANTVAPSPNLRPPPLNYTQGDLVIGVIKSATVAGLYEIYAENTTGKEPLTNNSKLGDNPTGATTSQLLRFTTTDFVSYTAPHTVLALSKGGTPTMKSMARSNAGSTSLYVLFTVYDTFSSFVSTDAGMTWTQTNISGVVKPDKDDLNLIYNQNRFVDMQIVKQHLSVPPALPSNWSMKYCDNDDTCSTRRVISAKTSNDGATWSKDQPLIVPDEFDPPELQFYRMRPFYVGDTSRVAAHVLQYAPSPSLDILGDTYGRQPVYCKGKGDIWDPTDKKHRNGSLCHGPHLHEEWWVGPASGDAADTSSWRRPYRRTHSAPHDAWLMAPPVSFKDELLVWVGSTGKVYTLPSYRIAGVYAPANGEASTPVIASLPATKALWVNADVKWKGREVTGGCDEGCDSYLFAALLDGESGAEIPGFGVIDAVAMTDVDGLKMVMQWKRTSSGEEGGEEGVTFVNTTALGGKSVRVRMYFRDAMVYAIGAE